MCCLKPKYWNKFHNEEVLDAILHIAWSFGKENKKRKSTALHADFPQWGQNLFEVAYIYGLWFHARDTIANFFITTTSKTLIQTDLPHDLIFIVFDAFIMHYIFSGLMQRFSTTNNFICRGPKVNSASKIFWLHCASLDRYGICHSLCSRAIWLVGMWPEVPSHVPYRQEFWLETTKPRWGPNHFWVAHYKNLGHSFAKIQIWNPKPFTKQRLASPII